MEEDALLEAMRKVVAAFIDDRSTGLENLIRQKESERQPMPRKTKEQNAMLKALRELGGEQFQESSIERKGTKLVLPATMSPATAINTLQAFEAAEEETTAFSRTFNYRPWDGAAAFERAIRILTGTAGIGKAQLSFFGSTPPRRITVNVGLTDTIEVPWGTVSVPLFDEGEVSLGQVDDPEYGPLFQVVAYVAKKYSGAVHGMFNLIQSELEENSIYKGKAINGAEMPEFIDLNVVDPKTVVYSDDVMLSLDTNIWSMLRHSDTMRSEGISLKRSVLLHGPYGTGKTLAGVLTAREAVANGWTFLMARPGKDNVFEVMRTARLYSPAVVFVEDVDTLSRQSSTSFDTMAKLLDTFDGIQAKGVEILNIMTTNHQDEITKAMLRPGRLDALIEIAELDLGGVTRMVQSLVEPENLDDINYEAVYDKMQGYLPAFVRESVDRAKLTSIAANGELRPLTTADLCNGAGQLRDQFDLMERADEVEQPQTLETAMTRVLKQSVSGMYLENQHNDDLDYVVVDNGQ
jgi:transitional endoplasmic reticulum ATPase